MEPDVIEECNKYALPSFQVRGTIESSRADDLSQPFIAKLQNEYEDVLTKPESACTFSPEIRGPFGVAHIELKPDAKPAKKKFFRCSQEREDAMTMFIAKLTSRGWIVPSQSEWAAQAFLVPKPADPTKKEKQWRLVVDYRYLNSQTKDDPFPLPLIEDLVYKQARNSLWTIFDLEDGFHQMHLAPASQELTAFVTSQGLYHWTVLPMGVKNGPAMFQRMISWILRDLPQSVVYIDDVLIGTAEETHSISSISTLENDSYTLLPEHKLRSLHAFGISMNDISVELFASESNATHKFYMSKNNSAFRYDWNEISKTFGWLWANPPFYLISKVLTKVVLEPCKLLLVIPKWETATWFDTLRSISIDYISISKNNPIFEGSTHSILQPPSWDVWVCRIDTTKRTISTDSLLRDDILFVKRNSRQWNSDMLQRRCSFSVSILQPHQRVTSNSLIECHYVHVRSVLNALRKHKLFVKGIKLHFFVPEIKFCGHILSHGQRRAAPSKLDALRKWTPDSIKTIRHLKGFLGLAQYYALYMKDYAKIACPLLHALKATSEKQKVSWTDEMKQCLDKIKNDFMDSKGSATIRGLH